VSLVLLVAGGLMATDNDDWMILVVLA